MGHREDIESYVGDLTDAEVQAAFYDWTTWARPAQQIPKDDYWTHWLIMAGRGWGKTRCGGEFVRALVETGKYGRIALVAEDAGDARDVMIEGESGILATSPPWNRPLYEPTKRRLTWPNGAVATVYSDVDPEALRGPQFDAAWIDELGKYKNAKETWSNLMFGLRLGIRPRTCITTTPRPIPLIRELIAREGKDVFVTRGTTYDNRANLAASFFSEIVAEYEGTAIGRQELYAELLDPEETGIIKRSWFRLWPQDKKLPIFKLIVQSYDTAYTEKTANDPTACVVGAVFEEKPGMFSVLIVDAWDEHLAYPTLRKRLIDDWDAVYGDSETPPSFILIEEKGSGINLLQDLRLDNIPVRGYNPGRADKTQRLHTTSPLFKIGRVYVMAGNKESNKKPRPISWMEKCISQLCSFPLVEHDDYVDAMTQLLIFLRHQGWLVVNAAPIIDESSYFPNAPPEKKANPYAS